MNFWFEKVCFLKLCLNFVAFISIRFDSYCPQATVTTVWKTPVCKRGVGERGNLKCPISYVLSITGWIKLIYDKITLIYSVKNAFNPTSEVQNIENGVFQNAPFASALFANGSFPYGDSCLWAECRRLVNEFWIQHFQWFWGYKPSKLKVVIYLTKTNFFHTFNFDGS